MSSIVTERRRPSTLSAAGPWLMRAALVAVGLVSLIGGLGYGVFTPAGLVGPGFVPVVAGSVMLIASAWDVAATLLERRSSDVAVTSGEEVEGATVQTVDDIVDAPDAVDAMGRTSRQRSRAVVVVFLVLIATMLLSQLVGLLLALAAMVFVLIWLVERKPWWAALLAGVLAFAFGYFVFGQLLEVPLPTGLLGLV